jgi:hypothetical protein
MRRRVRMRSARARPVRDIKNFEHTVLGYIPDSTLAERMRATIHNLNEIRPRPVLRGGTASGVYEQDRVPLPDREVFIQGVNHKEERLRQDATSRQDLDAARRRAVEQEPLRYRLMEIRGRVYTD